MLCMFRLLSVQSQLHNWWDLVRNGDVGPRSNDVRISGWPQQGMEAGAGPPALPARPAASVGFRPRWGLS